MRNRVPEKFNRVPGNFNHVPGHLNRVPGHFNSVPEHFDRVPEHFDRVPEHFNLQKERCEEPKLRKYKIIFDDTNERSSPKLCFEEGIFVALTYRPQIFH